MAFCCIECFSDIEIRNFVEENFVVIGNCEYCEREEVMLAETGQVGSFIREGIERAYEPNEFPRVQSGQTVYEILDDHAVFASYSHELATDLLDDSGLSYDQVKDGEIDSDGDLVRIDELHGPDFNRYQFSWRTFTQAGMHIARFFDVNVAQQRQDVLRPVLELVDRSVVMLPIGTPFVRVVRRYSSAANPIDFLRSVGPAPLRSAANNRMSPAGISYFYAADTDETAFAESRVPIGDVAYVGRFHTVQQLRIADLTQAPSVDVESIFSPAYDPQSYWAPQFLESFVEEIAQPVRDDDYQVGYVATQLVAEAIRARGFDGIRYRSSLHPGANNVVLFAGILNADYPYDWVAERLTSFADWLTLVEHREVRVGSPLELIASRTFDSTDFSDLEPAPGPVEF